MKEIQGSRGSDPTGCVTQPRVFLHLVWKSHPLALSGVWVSVETRANAVRRNRMIEFRSVSKRFDDGTLAVDDFSLVVPARKTTVLVGSSGSGKTTLLRMI